MSLLLNFAEFITPAIIVFAVLQSFVLAILLVASTRLRKRLSDALHNMVRGMSDQPERDSLRRPHDDIAAHLDFLISSCTNKETAERSIIWKNAKSYTSRHIDRTSYWLETLTSVLSAGIQLFPLMGIFGTILALGQTTLGADGFSASTVSKAFVIALDTTILGILFAIIFTLIDSVVAPSVDRTIEETGRYRLLLVNLAKSPQ